MRLAILYDILPETGFRNDGNPVMVWAALKRMEEKGLLEIDHLAPKKDMNLFGQYDAYLDVDWGEDGLVSVIPYTLIETPKPSIVWNSDTHLGFDYRLEKSRKADVVFCAQKQAVIDFEKQGVKSTWLPHAFEPLAYCDPETKKPYEYASKKYDICFVGHVNSPNRVDFLDTMFRSFPNFFFGQRRFHEACQKYAESKIVLNIAMKEDTNMRVFETLGSKGFLLTDRVPYIEELFEDGKHLVLYNSLEEAVDKAKYYLAHDEEREKIAQAGYDEVMAKHTIDHRVGKILEAANTFKNSLTGV